MLVIIACGILSEFAPIKKKSNAETISEDYEGDWKSPESDDFVSIGRVIIKNKLNNCGEYYIKKNKNISDEYVVACTSDGFNFIYHLVWVQTQKATSLKDDGITPPKRIR